MPYLQLELDALDAFVDVSMACGLSPGDVSIGLLRLWRHCLRNKSEAVSVDRLATFFPGDARRVTEALVTCEFLSPLKIGESGDFCGFEVRGAKKRLGFAAAKSRGGKTRTAVAARDEKGRLIKCLPEPIQVGVQVVSSTPPATEKSVQHSTSLSPAVVQLSSSSGPGGPGPGVQVVSRSPPATPITKHQEEALNILSAELELVPSPASKPKKTAEDLRLLWNALKSELQPEAQTLSLQRKKAAEAALKRRAWEQWEVIFRRISASDMCNRRTGMTWVANFDWAIRHGGGKPEPAERVWDGGEFLNGAVTNGKAGNQEFTTKVERYE